MKWSRVLQIAVPLCVIALLLWAALGSHGADPAHRAAQHRSTIVVAKGSGKLVESKTHTSTAALIIGLVVLLLISPAVFFLVRWIVRRAARLFRRRQATGLGSEYEQMISRQRGNGAAPRTGERPPLPAPQPQPEPLRKTCPDCAETVLAAAKVCRYCGYRFEPAATAAPPAE